MTSSDRHAAAVGSCALCVQHGLDDAPDRPARLGPLQLVVPLVRALAAIAAVAVAALAAPDPRDLRPRVLQDP